MKDRSVRRHTTEVKRKRAKHIITHVERQIHLTQEELDHQSRIRGDTFTVCSCDMCCNQRRNLWEKDRLTLQEKKAIEVEKDFDT